MTGGTGFVGSHFVRLAMRRDFDVTVLRRTEASEPRIPWEKTPSWITRPMDQLEKNELGSFDQIVHLAAHSANVPYDTLENCMHWNVSVPLKLFTKAADAGVGRFIVAGSCFEYGTSAERFEFIPPTAPLDPIAAYPTSKAAASIAFRSFGFEQKVSLSIHRIFQVFGEGEPAARLWPSLRRAAQNGDDFSMTLGEQVRDFIPVADVAEQLLDACLDRSVQPGRPKIANCGTGRPQTVRKFCEQWWSTWKAEGQLRIGEVPYRDNEVMRYVPALSDQTLVPPSARSQPEDYQK